MDSQRVDRFVSGMWDDEIVPQLIEYIRIPNKSPMFDVDWAKHGYMDDAVKLMSTWVSKQSVTGMQLEVVRLPGRTPVICSRVSVARNIRSRSVSYGSRLLSSWIQP